MQNLGKLLLNEGDSYSLNFPRNIKVKCDEKNTFQQIDALEAPQSSSNKNGVIISQPFFEKRPMKMIPNVISVVDELSF